MTYGDEIKLRTECSISTVLPVFTTQAHKYIVGQESKTCIFDFHIFQERQKTELLLLGVSYIAESQTGLYLVTSKFTAIGVFNFQ